MPAPDPALESAADAVLTASRALLGIAVRSVLTASVDVTVAQHRVLVVLLSQGPRTIGQIADELGVDQSNASRHCARLQRAGLVARRRSEMDGRAVEVTITSAGVELVDSISAVRRQEISAVLARMDPRAVEATREGLVAFSVAAGEPAGAAWVGPS